MKIFKLYNILILSVLSILSIHIYAQDNNPKEKQESNKIITLSAKSYEKETGEGVVLVDYWATWCGPCKKMEPILKEISTETSVKIAKLNVDDYKAFVNTQKVGIIPTMIIYKDGEEVKRLTGAYSKDELMEILKPYIVDEAENEIAE